MKFSNGQIAVITGAASGIGFSLAKKAYAMGMHVIMTDIDAEKLETSKHLLTQSSDGAGKVMSYVADVSNASDVANLESFSRENFGQVDLLFNCAGVLINKRIWEHTPDDWRFVMGVNFTGMTNLISAFVPSMIKENTVGHIVNFGSLASFFPSPLMGAYTASKFAILAMTETLKYELDDISAKIGVSFVAPGPVKTSIINNKNENIINRDTATGQIARSQMAGAIDQFGMDPDEVSQIVFDGIETDTFWIFTHPELMKNITVRAKNIREQQTPTYKMISV